MIASAKEEARHFLLAWRQRQRLVDPSHDRPRPPSLYGCAATRTTSFHRRVLDREHYKKSSGSINKQGPSLRLLPWHCNDHAAGFYGFPCTATTSKVVLIKRALRAWQALISNQPALPFLWCSFFCGSMIWVCGVATADAESSRGSEGRRVKIKSNQVLGAEAARVGQWVCWKLKPCTRSEHEVVTRGGGDLVLDPA